MFCAEGGDFDNKWFGIVILSISEGSLVFNLEILRFTQNNKVEWSRHKVYECRVF